jgi:hypothetical protein
MVTGPGRARRFSTETECVCARPGCGASATATLRFVPTEQQAWLVDLDDAGARTEGDLCARHATVLLLPSGWELHDGRDAHAPDVPPVRRPALRATRRELVVVSAGEPREEAPALRDSVDEPLEEQSVAGEPLREVFDVQTPLLRRAFQNVWPFTSNNE